MANRRHLLDRLYRLLTELEVRCGKKRCLAECHPQMVWPRRGAYFFFENGELRENGLPRVVRVGTHALTASKATLWSRLAQHKGSVRGAMPGGGNHRGSIFRKHVGSALLASGEWPDSVRDSWPVESSARPNILKDEYPLERAVSQYIGQMPLVWLEVDDS